MIKYREFISEGKAPKEKDVINDIIDSIKDMFETQPSKKIISDFAKNIAGDFIEAWKESGEGYGPFFDENIQDWIADLARLHQDKLKD